MDPVKEALQLALKPADLRPPWAWCEENYEVPVSSIPGMWRSDNSPWVKQLMEDFADNTIRQITVLCSAQSAKTETMLALLCWIVAEDPSPTMWVTSSDEEALKFCNERLMPSLRLCKAVKDQIPDSRLLAKSMEILFPTMMLECVGANSKAKLQSRSRRFLLLDEVRNWPDWALPMVKMRVRTWWNSRIVILTTPSVTKDKVHLEFLEGTQNHYHVPCLGCGRKAPLEFEQLKAEHPETRECCRWSEVPDAIDADGKWDLEKLAPHIRYVCKACGHMHRDHPAVRRRMALEGEWVAHNPKAPPHLKSYTWSAMLPPWVKWRNIVEQFLASQAALEFGDFEPFKAFITETLGKPWEDRLRFMKTEGYIDDRVVSCTTPFPTARRIMSIDVQGRGGRHFYWSIHDFARGGAQRIKAIGKAWSIEEIRAEIKQHQVPNQNVVIDTGKWAGEIYGYIMESGVLPDGNYAWKAMKGDKATHYMSEAGLRQPFTVTWVDPFLGSQKYKTVRPIMQWLFSKSSMLDRAEMIMRGQGPDLQIPNTFDPDLLYAFKQQVTAYERQDRASSTGEIKSEWIQKRPEDHWGSCFRQALVAAYATGIMVYSPK